MNEMITIPRAEYERLLAAAEDLADIAAYDRAKAEPGDAMPGRFFDRILAGENRLRVIREWRGLSGAELARLSGVNRVQISEIEAGRKRGSVVTVRRLADALGVGMEEVG